MSEVKASIEGCSPLTQKARGCRSNPRKSVSEAHDILTFSPIEGGSNLSKKVLESSIAKR